MDRGSRGADLAALLDLELDALVSCRQALGATELPAARALLARILLAHQARLERFAEIARSTATRVPDAFSVARGFATPGFVVAALRGTGAVLRAARQNEEIACSLYRESAGWKALPTRVRRVARDAFDESSQLVAALDAEIAGRVWERDDART